MTSGSFDFTPAEIPPRHSGPGRPAEPNPFLDKVAELVDPEGTPRDVAVSFTVPEPPDSTAVDRIKRQLARAGIVHGVSVFKRIEGADGGTLVTFWAQDRIIPQRKPKSTDSNGEGGADPGDDTTSAPVTEDAPSYITVLEP